LEVYKGIDVLVRAAAEAAARVVIAGPGELKSLNHLPIPSTVTVRNWLIADEDATDLFRHCGLLALPYVEASQSALVAAAYFFRKPVIVTRVGALPEYVVECETGWVIPPNDPLALGETLRIALADPGRLERMGRAGHIWYERNRQLDTETLLEMYAKVATNTHIVN
jgi:glycosyltransferase involved in cell wall biosynthesis